MKYQSTRSLHTASDTEAVLQGIAPDGGLYIDPSIGAWPFDWKGCLEKDSFGMAEQILSALLPGFDDMRGLVEKAYRGKFDTDELTPLVSAGGLHYLELYHGPTSAFKDVALSMLPQLVTAAKKQIKDPTKTLILTATSGDTGKAALEGFHDVEGTKIVVFYPDGGVSPVQRAQMVSQKGANVSVCAVRGNFDDCQRGVKEAFAAIREQKLTEGRGVELSSANSINIGRLAPQVTYYFIAYAKLVKEGCISVGDAVDYCVPTGNFGDILAGYYAKLLGLPVGKLICASNSNNVLTDFLKTGVYDARRPFYRTTSPSMDILVSSNLERLLYLAYNGDTKAVAECMKDLSENGSYKVSDDALAYIQNSFKAGCAGEDEVSRTIEKVWKEDHYLIDPHTAVAVKVAAEYKTDAPVVVLSTASPYKFPAAVLGAIGGDLSGTEFDQMRRLSEVTGTAIPKNLAALDSAEELHKDIINREEILDYVISRFE
ncbi:MAG: threonine synthase [Firmicutes bacterium]|nr:threonine synthase [Bacillota bacterium]